ncbi:MAG: hypothetical protein R3E32_05240 [Chitinophagales bacterium]
MKFSCLLLLFSSFVFLFGCNGDAAKTPSEPISQVKELQKEVMKIHDEAMAKMDLIYRLKKQVSSLADSLMKNDPSLTPKAKIGFNEYIISLEAADESMMNWMRNYKAPKDKSEEEAMAYLQDQMQKIEKVKKEMNEAITGAEEFVKKYQP